MFTKLILNKLTPSFWGHAVEESGPFKHMFNFRKIWKLTVFLMSVVSLLPLIIITLIDYNYTQKSIESESLLMTARTVSNAKRTLSFFITERKSALDFLIHENSFESLNNEKHLSKILYDLSKAFGGGFEDLGVIDAQGRQQAYVGPYNLKEKDYSSQPWFKKVVENGIYISDVFMGFREVPHLVIAVKYEILDGPFYILRSSINISRFNDQLSQLELSGRGDSFVINHQGIIQTPTRYYGHVLEKFPIQVPEYSEKTEAIEIIDPQGNKVVIGYAYISGTPFIIMVVKLKKELMKPWNQTRLSLIGFLIVSITIIMVVILEVSTFLVNSLYITDQKRLTNLHEIEYDSKMASIGRLAAGIAHEINNPLAIINEKAGLIKDLFVYKKEYANDPRLIAVVDSIISSVERCGVITKRLLAFARHADVNIQVFHLKELINEVLGFTGKEAEYRSICVKVDIPEDIPSIESDKGKMQQIFLNLVNNAFAAMSTDECLNISARLDEKDFIVVSVADEGCGIPESDLDRVFEPFFSTKAQKGGTGLGLSITYNLVNELGGRIEVQSEQGKGTTFLVTLPLKKNNTEEKSVENTTSG
ncbi:Two component system sensor histidine kinase, double cache domain-containing [Desulfonema limicola]|uniref:histidine kinase n=1 Tax=Desulfonema limicola TaxID=45656 RepID=A0A975BCZ5_9BACT|nr:PAS domain-containing sensor histidine kinase [Desulfonema limicola]QTA82929.1 Two component system sensor histidine kinase, double cache domain-containing [Desulfonema limicola]